MFFFFLTWAIAVFHLPWMELCGQSFVQENTKWFSVVWCFTPFLWLFCLVWKVRCLLWITISHTQGRVTKGLANCYLAIKMNTEILLSHASSQMFLWKRICDLQCFYICRVVGSVWDEFGVLFCYCSTFLPELLCQNSVCVDLFYS